MNDTERQVNYKQHRLRVQRATSMVKSHAPKPKPTSEDLRTYTFLEMMMLIAKNKQSSHLKAAVDVNEMKKFLKLDKEKKKNDSSPEWPIPFHIRQRYDQYVFMQDWQLMQKLLRPNIYLEFVINNSQQPLGRLVIQLFTEACPEMVLQFVQTCLAKQHDRFHVTRLLFPLWMEAELLLDDSNAFTSNSIEHDSSAINHGSSSGILSFPSRYLRGSKLPFITFTLSFTPIDVLNGKRIAFGVIKCGQKALERLQNLEVTRSGKPCKSIAVSACGVCN